MADIKKDLKKLSTEELTKIISDIQEDANKKCKPYIEELEKRYK